MQASQTNSTNFQASIPTSSLLGAYEIYPVLSNGAETATCNVGSSVSAFFVNTGGEPGQPGQAACSSMTGTWSDMASGQPTLTWNLFQTTGTGLQSVGGTATVTDQCNVSISFEVSGYYDGPTYNLYGTNPQPSTYSCGGTTYEVLNQYVNGSFSSNGACGLGSGTYSASDPSSGATLISGGNTLTANERVPDGEFSSFASWLDQYGYPTTASFNMRLTSQAGYVFGGRRVKENNIPGQVGTDGCHWDQAPFGPFTSLNSSNTWYVQTDNYNGAYGPDLVGLNPDVVAYIQLFSPAVASSRSC